LTLYLDTSAAVSFFIRDVNTAAAQAMVLAEAQPPIITSWTAAEFSSAALIQFRREVLSKSDLDKALNDFDLWSNRVARPVPIDDGDIVQANLFVRRAAKLRAPDALHIAICVRIGARLLTFDKVMGDAARSLGLPVVPA